VKVSTAACFDFDEETGFKSRRGSGGVERESPRELMTRTIVFAGGGSGGHIFPNIAIAERLRELGGDFTPYFLVSTRPLDSQLLKEHGWAQASLPVRPMTMKPWAWPGFMAAWRTSVKRVRGLIRSEGVGAVVVTGGFVSGPAVEAARREGIPVALVNLDAVPGKANRWLFSKATKVYSAYPGLAGAERVSVPLRRSATVLLPPVRAREVLGLDPGRDALLITGGSQGAQSLNRIAVEVMTRPVVREAMSRWQVFHLAGGNKEAERIREVYARAGVAAVVEAFCDRMGVAWSAATLAVSRSGAGSVAEVWANATPTIFLPYPYHKDQHQRLNAEELTRLGGAVLCEDLIDPVKGADRLQEPLIRLVGESKMRQSMTEIMLRHRLSDGALVIAQWLFGYI
jgi:UDP-N-acetylglucosamine--N-acetylmuramyl-(pentapeptide) pyrophosphoryl-undecaprenol N-acetylglucosamine transferase